MKILLVTIVAFVSVGGLVAWSGARPNSPMPIGERRVGTHPGGVASGRQLAAFEPAEGDSLVGFSAGCFWGSEEAFRKIPGIVATAVGYTGGTSRSPSYEVAHATGHVETVLVEFNPKRTPLSALLKTFWTLPRTTDSEGPARSKSPYRAAIWTYDVDEMREATASRVAMEKELHRKLRVQIGPAHPFFLAEELHQQYDEKAGKELCPLVP